MMKCKKNQEETRGRALSSVASNYPPTQHKHIFEHLRSHDGDHEDTVFYDVKLHTVV